MKPIKGGRRLLVFARNPIPGQVKTRLSSALGPHKATAVYWRILRGTLTAAAATDVSCRELWIDRSPVDRELAIAAQQSGLSVRRQSGADLGERMLHALSSPAACSGAAVLIGTDCPEIDTAYLNAAFLALTAHDAVIGPASDGGYVLIGMQEPQHELFRDIRWGGPTVYAETLRRMRGLGWRCAKLPTLHDVDRLEDLLQFPDLAALAAANPHPLDASR